MPRPLIPWLIVLVMALGLGWPALAQDRALLLANQSYARGTAVAGAGALADAADPLALADARAALGRGLAIQAAAPEAAEQAAAALRGWSLATTGQGAAQSLSNLPKLTLPRSLRALAVLYGLARRRGGQAPLLDGPVALAAAMRIGMLGI